MPIQYIHASHPGAAKRRNEMIMHAFVVNGESVCTLSELVAENAHDHALCAWAQTAMPGDCYGGGAGGSAECIDIARTAVQNTAARTAHDIIEAIAADLGLDASALTAEDRRRIRYGLEDGAALAYLGFGDADQDAIEEAHGMMQ